MSSGNTVQFLVLGDWGEDNFYQDKNAVKMSEIFEEQKSNNTSNSEFFVISVGDNFYPSGVEDVDDDAWRVKFTNMYKRIQCPWYPVLGNHDYEGNAQAQIDFSADKRWQMDDYYYSKVVGNIHFIFIDTVMLCPEYSDSIVYRPRDKLKIDFDVDDMHKQRKWIEDELKASTSEWIIAVGHYPVYSCGIHGSNATQMSHVDRLFKKYKIDAYFCGHDHSLQHIYNPETTQYHHFLSGSGSGTAGYYVKAIPKKTAFCRTVAGFANVTIEGSEMTVNFTAYNGDVLHSAVVHKQFRPNVVSAAGKVVNNVVNNAVDNSTVNNSTVFKNSNSSSSIDSISDSDGHLKVSSSEV